MTLTEIKKAYKEYCTGNTYAARKAAARETAIDYSYSWAEGDCYSMSELVEIEGYFRELGKRYGLLTEFKENAIC